MKRTDVFALGLGILTAAWISWTLVEREDVRSTPVESKPFVTEKKIQLNLETSTVLQFKQYTAALLDEVPTVEDLKSEHEQFFHSLPQSVRNFAPRLAHVQSIMRADDRNIEAGLQFYGKCATHPNALVTIRAVCMKMFRIWDKRTVLPVSEEIARIANSLPGDDL